ncbi:MAG: hypothetical protein ACOC3J_00175 [Gemmatimonadota bacterium]
MKQDRTTEYATAFVVGALLGVGAALLFAPEPPTRRERIARQLAPYRKKLSKQSVRARKQVGSRASAAADWSDEMLAASRTIMSDMRAEVADLVANAREEIADAVAAQLGSAQKSLKKSAKRIRS